MNLNEADDTQEALTDALAALSSISTSSHDEMRALKRAIDAASSALAERLHQMEQSYSHRVEDAASMVTWARRELRLDDGQIRSMARAASSLKHLPAARASFARGAISVEHARLFDFSIRHVGLDETRHLEAPLLAVAESNGPSLLRRAVGRAKAVRHPDALDEAWIRGMERRDLQVSPVGDGWHVTGFLPIEVGARFKSILTSWSTPITADDQRTSAQRRVDGLDEALKRFLESGLPTDGTVPPQIHVMVDAGTLRRALSGPQADGAPFTPEAPATLIGFGEIGPRLLAHLACGASFTPYLVEPGAWLADDPRVLDVGRSQRFATGRQRKAVWLQQGGVCDRSGCANPIDHVHHDTPWSEGGATDLSNLVGLCHACHVHVHRHVRVARAG